jgi:hypothetical protein
VLIKHGQLKISQTGQEGPTRVMASESTVVHRAVAEIGPTLDQGKGSGNKLTNQSADLGFQRETLFGDCGC